MARYGIVRRPDLNFSRLAEKDVFAAFSGAVENYYRYYQYYSNTLIAVAIAFGAYVYCNGSAWLSELTIGIVLLEITLLLASGDSLSRYYNAASQILTFAEGKANDERMGTPKGTKQEGSAEEAEQEGLDEEDGDEEDGSEKGSS